VVKLTNNNATAEAGVVKVRVSDWNNAHGDQAVKLGVTRIRAMVNSTAGSVASVELTWDRSPAERIALISPGVEYEQCYEEVGGFWDTMSPGDTNLTGDILLSWPLPASTDSYDIEMELEIR